MTFNYSNHSLPIREDISEAHRDVWARIARPGNWWRSEDRVAFVAESRAARHCTLCGTRAEALSPYGGENTTT